MRRTYIEDAVLVLGGGVLIAVAWLIQWQAGLIVAALVCMLIAILAYRHTHTSASVDHHRHSSSKHGWTGAASWRHHGHAISPRERSKES